MYSVETEIKTFFNFGENDLRSHVTPSSDIFQRRRLRRTRIKSMYLRSEASSPPRTYLISRDGIENNTNIVVLALLIDI